MPLGVSSESWSSCRTASQLLNTCWAAFFLRSSFKFNRCWFIFFDCKYSCTPDLTLAQRFGLKLKLYRQSVSWTRLVRTTVLVATNTLAQHTKSFTYSRTCNSRYPCSRRCGLGKEELGKQSKRARRFSSRIPCRISSDCGWMWRQLIHSIMFTIFAWWFD